VKYPPLEFVEDEWEIDWTPVIEAQKRNAAQGA
jgi:hypothetical protein